MRSLTSKVCFRSTSASFLLFLVPPPALPSTTISSVVLLSAFSTFLSKKKSTRIAYTQPSSRAASHSFPFCILGVGANAYKRTNCSTITGLVIGPDSTGPMGPGPPGALLDVSPKVLLSTSGRSHGTLVSRGAYYVPFAPYSNGISQHLLTGTTALVPTLRACTSSRQES